MTYMETPPVQREAAHARSVRSGIEEVVRAVQDVLGQALVAVIVDKDVRTVGRWLSTTGSRPTSQDDARLRDTLQVIDLLVSREAPSVARAWFMGMNPRLEDESPAEALAEGRTREVMAAARAFINAG